MAHLYSLTGPLPSDPHYLSITTDDDGLISEMAIPFYRSADQITKSLVTDWRAYAEAIGSPSGVQIITEFTEYIRLTYGQTYVVRAVW